MHGKPLSSVPESLPLVSRSVGEYTVRGNFRPSTNVRPMPADRRRTIIGERRSLPLVKAIYRAEAAAKVSLIDTNSRQLPRNPPGSEGCRKQPALHLDLVAALHRDAVIDERDYQHFATVTARRCAVWRTLSAAMYPRGKENPLVENTNGRLFSGGGARGRSRLQFFHAAFGEMRLIIKQVHCSNEGYWNPTM